MRIAIIAHLKFAISEPFAGGLEAHTHMLAKAMRERGHDVTLFASTKSNPKLGVEAICDETALLQTGTAEAQDVTFFREHHAYLRLMQELRIRDFDVIHNNSLHYLPVVMADMLSAPMITSLHTPPFCWLESGVRLSRADMHYVAVSAATAAMWRPVMKVDSIIPNGIDLREFAFRAQPDPEPYLIWYGRIVPEKGLDLAIAAAQRAGIPLRIAGPVSNPEFFEREVAPHLGADIRYVGHLAHKELSALIGGARAALCTPRWEEPYGLVVAEALACGTPVAAFRRGGVAEILDADCGILVEADNVEQLAGAAVAATGLDRKLCRRRAEAICDVRGMIDGYEILYRSLADRSRTVDADADARAVPTLAMADQTSRSVA